MRKLRLLSKAQAPLFVSMAAFTLTACMGGGSSLPGQNPIPTSVLFSEAPTSMSVGTSATILASAIYANAIVTHSLEPVMNLG